MNGGPSEHTKEERVQNAVSACCATFQLPNYPSPEWRESFEQLGVSQEQLDCICDQLKPYGIEGPHKFSDTTPWMLVEEQTR